MGIAYMVVCCALSSLILLATSIFSCDMNDQETCPSPQYLELGHTGTVQCLFGEEFTGVLWYYTPDYARDDLILHYTDVKISGAGYTSGKFDIYSNGSLVIKTVSLEHERTFGVALVSSGEERRYLMCVEVIVIVKPSIRHPVILNCGDYSSVCFGEVNTIPITCQVSDVRPNITLQLIAKTADGDKIITSGISFASDEILNRVNVSTTDAFRYSHILALIACKATSPPGMLEKENSLILAQNGEFDVSKTTATPVFIERHNRLKLNCTEKNVGFLVWKRFNSLKDDKYTLLMYKIFFGELVEQKPSRDISIASDGSLIIPFTEIKHGGLYTCIFGDGLNNDVTVYNVAVLVAPAPAYPLIEGCEYREHCVFNASRQGNITCSVKGIYPEVQLEFTTFHNGDVQLISFENKQHTIRDNGETYDVSLTSSYYIEDWSRTKIIIKCEVSSVMKDLFDLKTEVDLILTGDTAEHTKQNVPQPTNKMHLLKFLVVVPVMAFGLGVCFVIKKVLQKYPHAKQEKAIAPEMTPMVQPLERNILNSTDLKEVFVKQLKETYKDLYDRVQPIPYIKDRLYCVDRVFVEGGIEIMIATEGNARRQWYPLKSYNDVFADPRAKSQRRILEGDPGYGKSTVTLQFAYDWCNSVPGSALKDTEILIVLRLRQLGGVSSIYKAIKQFILPKDSQLEVDSITDILHHSTSVVIILDGFDEYPNQDLSTRSDVIDIIERKMFQDYDVVLTTRSSFLPEKYPPLTKRIKLTGFDKNARRFYIQKAVVGDDEESVHKIEGYLQENPVLSDLCQVPLLFVIFAHMSHENEKFRKLHSVTAFFRYMTSCFHSHMKNKMSDDNVLKFRLFEADHVMLDRVAFEALNSYNQKIVWQKDDMSKRIGLEFYEQYKKIGILVEEEVIDIADEPGTLVTEHVKYSTEVRFYHKLFCEWYAAHFLSKYLQQNPAVDLHHFLEYLDPLDLQYTYRFACGLNPDCAEKIINYLKNIDGGDTFAILCILEQTGKFDNIKETVRQLCSKNVIISGHDSLLLQRSSMQLLEIAAKNGIPIKLVRLHNCLKCVDISTSAIITKSGLSFSSRIPVRWLVIDLSNRVMTADEASALLEFASLLSSLEELGFLGCVPPGFLKKQDTLSVLDSLHVTVKWKFLENSPWYILDLKTGKWKHELDGHTPTEEEYEEMRLTKVRQLELATEDYFKNDLEVHRDYLRNMEVEGVETQREYNTSDRLDEC